MKPAVKRFYTHIGYFHFAFYAVCLGFFLFFTYCKIFSPIFKLCHRGCPPDSPVYLAVNNVVMVNNAVTVNNGVEVNNGQTVKNGVT